MSEQRELRFSKPIWVLTGPTGSGKSAYGLRVAETIGAEIIAMDSMTLYRGMDIGTAKPSLDERRRVPHHLLDVLDPWESANVAWWLDQAVGLCREIQARGRSVLLVGGTPLYLKALLHGIFAGPPADVDVRRRLETSAVESGSNSLHVELSKVDPATAARLHPNDSRRIVRALEVWELTGKSISDWQQQWGSDASNDMIRCRWIERPRSELYARINERVERMIERGWVDEVKRLRALPKPMSREAGQALGYAEIGDLLDGKIGLLETIGLIQTRSRQFAKRQMTWFRHLPRCQPLRVEGDDWPAVDDWIDFSSIRGEKAV